jgi:sterol-4alpha-carboxylate 3-dehydrogenase (decarboxylating)
MSSTSGSPLAHGDAVLVTGGCGFLGSHLVDALVVHGFGVVAASRNPTRYRNSSARYCALDLHSYDATRALILDVKPCAIIHTANPGPMCPPAAHLKDYQATKNLLELAYTTPSVIAFIYTGSAQAISNSSGSQKITEADAIFHTRSSAPTAYARWKAESEQLTLTFNRPIAHLSGSLRTVVIRLPGIYGPRDGQLAPGLLQATNTIIPRLQFGGNKPVHEWIYVESAANAHLLAAKALLDGNVPGIDGEAFFVADEEPVRFWDFARKLWAAAGDKNAPRLEKRILLPWAPVIALATLVEFLTIIFTLGRGIPPMSRHHLEYMRFGAWWDTSKARERLQYEPLVSTDEGIARAVTWYQQELKK